MKTSTKILIGLGAIGLGVYLYLKKVRRTAIPSTEQQPIEEEVIGRVIVPNLTIKDIPPLTPQQERAKQECARKQGYMWVDLKCVRNPEVPTVTPPVTSINQGIVKSISTATVTPIWTEATNPNLSCFLADTMITMGDGSKSEIQNIRIGDMVLSWNEESNIQEISKVTDFLTSKSKEIYEIKFSDDNKLKCTKEHPFFVLGKGWVTTKDLKKGDIAQNKQGKPIAITDINIFKSVDGWQVYNITVEGNHNYYANEILVHNKETVVTGTSAQTLLQQLQEAYSENTLDTFFTGTTTTAPAMTSLQQNK